MYRKIACTIFILITSFVIKFFYEGISAYDMRFYSGKDNGVFAILESVCILSAFFYFLLARNKGLLYFIVGFFVGIISFILGYFISMFSPVSYHYSGLATHILSCIIFMSFFFFIERRLQNNEMIS